MTDDNTEQNQASGPSALGVGLGRTRQTIWYDIPLHDETRYMAQLGLPRDMTEDECARLCATIRILAVPNALPNAIELRGEPRSGESSD